ncbi:hypothetical protein ACI2IY_05675 [Lysobacter enzymogenes]|uniref:hypothetical protein n=1 Tax=Lysobacter enzymogenes TaxID=69 RepID=UPI00384BFDE6
MSNTYPRMLYPGGDATARGVLVANEDDENRRRDNGYLRLGEKAAAKPTKPAAPEPPKPAATEPEQKPATPAVEPPKAAKPAEKAKKAAAKPKAS